VDGLPALDALTIGAMDVQALMAFSETYGFKGLAKSLGAHAAGGPSRASGRPFGDARSVRHARAGRATAYCDASEVRHHPDLGSAGHLAGATAGRRPGGGGHRDHVAGRNARRDRGHELQRDARRGGLHAAGPQLPRCARPAAARRGAGAAEALAGRRHKKKLGQHVKYDRHVFANHGIEVQGYAHDTMLQSYVLEVHKPHGLASLAERHLGRSGISYEDLCGKGAHQISFSQVDIAKAAEYSCEDSDQTLDVHLAAVAAA
jgi:DNA polymerase-1